MAFALQAQVAVDVPLRFTGGGSDRSIDTLAAPVGQTSAITVMHAATGASNWGTATLQGQVLQLTTTPSGGPLREGLLLRFLAPANAHGILSINLDGAGAIPLRRPDGLWPAKGQIVQGAVVEVVYENEGFVLLAPVSTGCPPGTVQVTGGFCIDTSDAPGFNFYTATEYCARTGGRLCKWDEYYAACMMVQGQLSGLFNGWEWIDDTSDHSQTADQCGNNTCESQRSTGPMTNSQVRCCYTLR
ncbi:MAG: hypothetical protein KIT10_06300 [Flavobacteriales bacterium]|nr:hypothetical protein [Flavobacteriales bacterium]